MEQNLTTGSVWKTLFRFSLPYLLSYFLQTLYGMADLFIIGRFDGVESVTAVSIGSQAMHMFMVMIVGLAMGATVLVGQAVGAGKRRQASLVIGNTVSLFLTLSVAATAALLLTVEPLVRVMATPPEAESGTALYLTICFLGIPFITAYNIISAVFRGLGDSKSPMYFIAVACGANIALDYLFIGGFGMGPAGAALGTVLSQTVSVAVALGTLYFHGKKGKRRGNVETLPAAGEAAQEKEGLSLTLSDFKPRREILGRLLFIGIPVAFQDGFIQIAFLVITVIANRRGLNDAAAVGIVEKIISLLFLVPSSMLQAVSALSAQNVGAGKHDRARKTLFYAAITTFLWGVLAAICVQLDREAWVSFFTADREVARLGGQYIQGYVWDVALAGIHFCFSGYFCAYGLSGLSFLHNVISIVCVRIPGSYLASVLFADTLFPMGCASTAGSALSAVICTGAFLWLLRRQKKRGASEAGGRENVV